MYLGQIAIRAFSLEVEEPEKVELATSRVRVQHLATRVWAQDEFTISFQKQGNVRY